jgi:hypothetical protein
VGLGACARGGSSLLRPRPDRYLYVKRSFGVTALVSWPMVTVTSTVPSASGERDGGPASSTGPAPQGAVRPRSSSS